MRLPIVGLVMEKVRQYPNYSGETVIKKVADLKVII